MTPELGTGLLIFLWFAFCVALGLLTARIVELRDTQKPTNHKDDDHHQ